MRRSLFAAAAVAAAVLFAAGATAAVGRARESAAKVAVSDAVTRAVKDGCKGLNAELAADECALGALAANVSALAERYYAGRAAEGAVVRLGSFTRVGALALVGPAIKISFSAECSVSCVMEWRSRPSFRVLCAVVSCRVYPGGLSASPFVYDASVPVLMLDNG